MCEELNAELARGKAAIEAVAHHVIAMGAGSLTQTVAIDEYLIQVRVDVVANAQHTKDEQQDCNE